MNVNIDRPKQPEGCDAFCFTRQLCGRGACKLSEKVAGEFGLPADGSEGMQNHGHDPSRHSHE